MGGVFELFVKSHFSAAHAIEGYAGDCARIHGHNWMIEVYARCKRLDALGMGVDFRLIERSLEDLLDDLDHRNLNELPDFKGINPTSENIARFIYKGLSGKLNDEDVKISRVKVGETPGAGAFYWEE